MKVKRNRKWLIGILVTIGIAIVGWIIQIISVDSDITTNSERIYDSSKIYNVARDINISNSYNNTQGINSIVSNKTQQAAISDEILIRGVVYDKQERIPLDSVSIQIETTDTLTNENGEFTIRLKNFKPTDRGFITACKRNYIKQSKLIMYNSNERISFELNPEQ